MLLQIMHLGQAALAAYGANQSLEAISRLRTYEKPSEKLAQYSSTAAKQLEQTRTTQGAAAVTLVLSLVVSLLLAFRGFTYSALVRYGASPLMVLAFYGSRRHLQDFWANNSSNNKNKDGLRDTVADAVAPSVPVVPSLPKLGDYAEAQRRTEELLKVMAWLMMSWFCTSLVALLAGYR